MPQVPYSGAPQVEPQNDATPRLSANTPIGAFGGDVAQATSHLGDTLSASGNQIFARGVAMQDLYNHSQASQAVSDYQEQAGEIHAKFSALQGKDAVAAFPQYIADLKSARQKIQDGLDNPATQQMFQGASLSFQGRTIFNGAGHAATENKKYAVGAATARVQSATSAALMNPLDDESFNKNLEDAKQSTIAAESMQGADPDTINNAVANTVSKNWVGRIATIAKTQPFQANAMLEKASADGSIRGEALGKITNLVQGAMHTVGARNVSQQVRSGADLSPGAGIVDQSRAREAIGQYESGANYSTLGPQTVDKSGNVGQALGKYQVMSYNLPSWLKQAGLPPMSAHDFVADHAAQDKVFDTIFGGYQQKYGSFNAATKAWFGGEGSVHTDSSKLSDGYHTADQYLAATNKTLAGSMGLENQISAGRSLAQQQSPNDPLYPDYVAARITTDAAHEAAVQRFSDNQRVDTIRGAILQGDDGKPFANIDQLKQSSPEADVAYSQLDHGKQMQVQRNITSYYNSSERITHQETAQELRGLAYGSSDDVDKFLNTNIFEKDLSQSDMNHFIGMQKQLQKDRGGNVEVRQALQMAKPQLDAAGVDLKDPVLAARFRGTYIDAVYDWKQANPNKPLDQDTAKKIVSNVIQQQSSENFWYGKDNTFNLPLPISLEKQIRKQKPDISDSELEVYRQEFVRQQVQALSKTKSKVK